MEDVLKLLKSAKEAELEAIKMLIEKNIGDSGDDDLEEASKRKRNPSKTQGKTKAVSDDSSDETTDTDYDGMPVSKLYELCCKRGISSKVKNDRKKASLIRALREYDNENADAENSGSDEEWTDEEWEEEKKPDYSSMKPRELFNECKKRGLSVKPNKKASEYIKVLKADDASEEGQEEDGEDWEID